MDIVRTYQLTKRYNSRTVVDAINLQVPEGSVYGFIGPNGSGKSTTMKMLLSLVTPTSGGVQVMGRTMDRSTRQALLQHIGSLIEAPPGYQHLTGAENMRIVQRTLGLPDAAIIEAVAAVRMQDQMNKRVRNYSLGMKQRLGIAMALARRPRLLVLDEPTNGLDPAGIEEMRHLIRALANHGTSVMVSSHILGEVDKVADVIGIISSGSLVFQGTRNDLLKTSAPDVLIETSHPDHAASALRRRSNIPATVDRGRLRLPGFDQHATAGVVKELVNVGAPIYSVYRDEQRLEDVFMALTRGGQL
ncbi:ABC transporter ATP-binding protein [Actinomyces stomatis]|jgi:ABC transporter related protein|uniref:ABC transporter ATP-binding protein n=1 Tax=Actinomyces stomatis TaxID=3050227 RepID=UPI002852BB75|nr:ATP-binding cassette domain-containing protein [Actinomyces sp. PK606]